MPYEEINRKPYKSPCACGKGIVRYYCVIEENDWNQERDYTTEAEILCDYCKEHYYFKRSYNGDEFLVPKDVAYPEPSIELQRKQNQIVAQELREIEAQSFQLDFVYDKEQDDRDHEKAREEQEEYTKAHMYDDFYARVSYHPTFAADYTGRYWDSLSIKECVDPQFLILDKPQYGTAEITIVKRYLCVCSVCKTQLIANSSDFEILFDEEKGFYPKLSCDCHKVSSFEAKTMAILDDLGVRYAREVSFSGLNGDSGFPLRFDFGLYEKLDESGNPAYSVLIELQGPHHFKMGFYDEYGMFVEDSSEKAKRKLVKQADYDDRKSQFCAENGIPLETIKYTASKSYDDFEELIIGIASKYGLIDDDKDLPF